MGTRWVSSAYFLTRSGGEEWMRGDDGKAKGLAGILQIKGEHANP
jgi:hypothetical protein